jgi:hypothetical protein
LGESGGKLKFKSFVFPLGTSAPRKEITPFSILTPHCSSAKETEEKTSTATVAKTIKNKLFDSAFM